MSQNTETLKQNDGNYDLGDVILEAFELKEPSGLIVRKVLTENIVGKGMRIDLWHYQRCNRNRDVVVEHLDSFEYPDIPFWRRILNRLRSFLATRFRCRASRILCEEEQTSGDSDSRHVPCGSLQEQEENSVHAESTQGKSS